MTEVTATLENALESLLRRIVKEEIRAASSGNDYHNDPFLTPSELAKKLHATKKCGWRGV